MGYSRYTFQQSLIWEGSDQNAVDPQSEKVTLAAKSEVRARARLGRAGIGRRWILVDVVPKGGKK